MLMVKHAILAVLTKSENHFRQGTNFHFPVSRDREKKKKKKASSKTKNRPAAFSISIKSQTVNEDEKNTREAVESCVQL